MKEIINQYRQKKPSDHVFVLRDLYNIYSLHERSEGRTPITYEDYHACMDRYIYYLWLVIIRCNYVFSLAFGLGSYLVAQLKRTDKPMFTFRWKKSETRKFPNQQFYKFKECLSKKNSNYGRQALRAWVIETRHNPSLNGYDAFL